VILIFELWSLNLLVLSQEISVGRHWPWAGMGRHVRNLYEQMLVFSDRICS
jgi:hypothetical protein